MDRDHFLAKLAVNGFFWLAFTALAVFNIGTGHSVTGVWFALIALIYALRMPDGLVFFGRRPPEE